MPTVSLLPEYDRQNGWLEILGPQPEPTVLTGDLVVDHVVIGAGYGGLAVARRLAELDPAAEIVLVEADRIGNNAAGRCSGFIIDHAHNIRSKGFKEDTENAKRQIALNRAGIDWLEEIVTANGIDCDWQRVGKTHAAGGEKGAKVLQGFAESLDAIDEDYETLNAEQLKAKFGTGFYQYGIHCPHSVIAQPAQLAIGLAESLPENVRVFENSAVTDFELGPPHVLRTERGTLTTPSLVIAANGFGEGFGLFKNRLLPLITWGSMTRPMTDDEVEALGGENDYGIIPAHPAGTTVRRRPDNRILIRNQYTFSRNSDARTGMAKIVKVHEKSFRNRYPMLPDLEFEYSWGGALSLSRNGAGVCGKIGDGLWSTMAYQGVGMAKGTISGKFLAEHMMGETDPLMDLVLGGTKPSRNYPDPFNRWGVAMNARWRRWQAGIEE